MTIGNAMAFIKRGMGDVHLRERLNAAVGIVERDAILADEQLYFSNHDFEEAFRNRLTMCQTAEAADQLKELKMWWDMLAQLLQTPELPG